MDQKVTDLINVCEDIVKEMTLYEDFIKNNAFLSSLKNRLEESLKKVKEQ